jgi:hypothetical protein
MVPYEFGHEMHETSGLLLGRLNFLHLNYFGSMRGNAYWNQELFRYLFFDKNNSNVNPNMPGKLDDFLPLRHLDYFSRSFFNSNLFFIFFHDQLLNIEKNS